MSAAAVAQRVPWMEVTVDRSETGGVTQVHAACRFCPARVTAPVDSGEQYVGAVALGLSHAEECPVPDRMANARAARWN